MKTPLALYNLRHQWQKTIVSIAGVAFALLLVFMQLGFMGAVSKTATNVLENLQFDILIRARDYLHLYEPSQFERKWLNVARSTPGVANAKPMWITLHNWRKLPTAEQEDDPGFESQYLPIAVMAYEIHEQVFRLDDVIEQQSILSDGRQLLLDRSTQRDYGPSDGRQFSVERDLRRSTEIGGQEFSIAGLFKLGTGLAANGAAIISQQGFARIVPWDVNRRISIGLIDVDSEQSTVDEVIELLHQRLRAGEGDDIPAAVEILTKAEALRVETRHWLWDTPIGLIFQLGVVLSLLVGAAIVYMVLSTDVANRLPEYATLLAMGYSRLYLASVVMTKALTLCFLGFFTAWAAAEALYAVTSWASQIPIAMTSTIVYLVGILGLVMCCCSGLLALRKLWKAEPASLF
jgi:putative ABC transport system permease protein